MLTVSPVHAALDPNMLVALDALLSERSVTRAAEKLRLTPSAVSHRLRALRDALSDPLLVSARGGFVLTARAEAIREPLSRALVDMRAAVEASTPFEPRTATRHFVIATADYGEFAYLPGVLALLRAEAPRVTCALVPPGRETPALLASSSVDLALGPGFPELPGLVQKKLATEGFLVVARNGHPKVGSAPLSLKRYLTLDHLLIAPDGRPGGIVDDLLAARGLRRHVALRVSHFATAPFLVASSDLVLTAPERLTVAARQYVDLTVCAPPLTIPNTEVFMCWHERTHRDPAQKWLRRIVESAFGSPSPSSAAERSAPAAVPHGGHRPRRVRGQSERRGKC